MIETVAMDTTSTSLELLSQAASLVNGTPRVCDYGSGVVSSSNDLPTKGQKVRRKKSARREAALSSALRIRLKKNSSGGEWDMDKCSVQRQPPPPYPSSVLPPYPSSYRGDPLALPQNTSLSQLKDCNRKEDDNNNNNNNAPLDMSRKKLQGECKQLRPSVITCVSSQTSQCCHKEPPPHSSSEDEIEELPQGHRREVLSGVCDPVIDEHFRRSLGKDYSEIFASNPTPSVSVTVDDHFAKALGDTWLRLQKTKPIKEKPASSRQPPSLVTL